MAPEVLYLLRYPTAKVDIWSLGVMLYVWVFHGTLPYDKVEVWDPVSGEMVQKYWWQLTQKQVRVQPRLIH